MSWLYSDFQSAKLFGIYVKKCRKFCIVFHWFLSSKKHVLTVLLVHVGDSDRAFLVERAKRPYKGKLSLPGGRLVMDESIEEGTVRILNKFGVKGVFKKINSISLEHLKKGRRVVASYLLIYINASSNCEMINLKENKAKIIESDYRLMTKDSKKRIIIESINSRIK